MCGSIAGGQSHGFLEMPDSIVDAVQFHQGGAEVSVDIRLFGADAEGCFECCNAIFYLIHLKICEAEQFIGFEPLRAIGYHGFQVWDSRSHFALTDQRLCQQRTYFEMRWSQFNCSRGTAFSGFEALQLR